MCVLCVVCSYPTYTRTVLITNMFGVMVDKNDYKALDYIVGIRLPIWDARTSSLIKDLYIPCLPINVTGLGVTNHVVGALEAFGLNQLYQREYIPPTMKLLSYGKLYGIT